MITFKKGIYSRSDVKLLCDVIKKAKSLVVPCCAVCSECSHKLVCNYLVNFTDYLEKLSSKTE